MSDQTGAQTVKLRLTLDVAFVPNGVTEAELKSMLEEIANHAANRGMMTCDTEAEVDSWSAKVDTIPA